MSKKALDFFKTQFGLTDEQLAQFDSEDFDMDSYREEFENTQAELWKTKHLPSLADEIKKTAAQETLNNAIKPLANRLKQSGIYEDWKDVDSYDELKERLDVIGIKYQEAIKNKKVEGVSEWENKYLQLQNKYESDINLKDERITEINQQFETYKANAAKQYQLDKASEYLSKRISNKEVVTFDSDSRINYYGSRIKEEILNKYHVDAKTGEVKSLDGTTKAMRPDGKNFYKNVDEVIRDIAERDGLTKKSNGGTGAGGRKVVLNQKGEPIDTSGSDALAGLLGIG